MSTRQNQIYTFDGLHNPYILSELDKLVGFKGDFSADKNGFFKGDIESKERHKILGHIKHKSMITRLAFILTIDDYANPTRLYSLFSCTAKDLEGKYVGGWYANLYQLNPKLFRDYDMFMKLIDSAGSIGGYAEMNLSKNNIYKQTFIPNCYKRCLST